MLWETLTLLVHSFDFFQPIIDVDFSRFRLTIVVRRFFIVIYWREMLSCGDTMSKKKCHSIHLPINPVFSGISPILSFLHDSTGVFLREELVI
jgi:hypothetical protein